MMSMVNAAKQAVKEALPERATVACGYKESLYRLGRAFKVPARNNGFSYAWGALNTSLRQDRILARHKERRFRQPPYQLRNDVIYEGRKRVFNKLVSTTISSVLRRYRQDKEP